MDCYPTIVRETVKWQLSGTVRPSMDYIIQNAHVQGGMFRDDATTITNSELSESKQGMRSLNHCGVSVEYGLVVTRHNFSITFQEKNLYGMINERRKTHCWQPVSLHSHVGKTT